MSNISIIKTFWKNLKKVLLCRTPCIIIDIVILLFSVPVLFSIHDSLSA